jgi:hypothetical protein
MTVVLTKRTKVKKVELIPESAPEPETVLCEEPKLATIKREVEKCSEPCIFEAWSKGLCYQHFRESQGFKFSETQGKFIKTKEKR